MNPVKTHSLKAPGDPALDEPQMWSPAFQSLLMQLVPPLPLGALHSNLSLCHLKLGATAAAAASAQLCIAAHPAWEKGYFRKGEAFFAERRYKEAAGLYKDGLAAAPGDATIAGRLALAREAVEGFYFRQLLSGRDIAVTATNATEMQVLGAAWRMLGEELPPQNKQSILYFPQPTHPPCII